MVKQISHIGIAVSSIREQIPLYRDILGMKFLGTEEIPEQKVRIATFRTGDIHIELLESTSEDSPVGKFISRRGSGIHHIAYEVDDLEGNLKKLKDHHHLKLVNDTPRPGSNNTRIAFIHPDSTFGVLTELVERISKDRKTTPGK